MFFFLNDTATTEIYPLSLHDALPISGVEAPTATTTGWALRRDEFGGPDGCESDGQNIPFARTKAERKASGDQRKSRSEEHTSELQSRLHLVCRLLLEKKKNTSLSHRT